MLSIDEQARKIIRRLQSAGFQAYLVGGSVRDLLLGRRPAEWDITTSAQPAEVGRLFPKVIPTGIDFGTVTVLANDLPYEVTTFRSDEQYIDGRHPANVRFTADLHQDLARRDFTINALAYDPEKQLLVDDFNGQVDLKNRLIRTVGNPLERFREDGLRPVRGCRLAATLDFVLEKQTLLAITDCLETVKKVAAERVHDELVKLLKADKPSIGLEYMRQSGLLQLLLPEVAACYQVAQPPEFHPHDVYWHSLYACDAAPKDWPLVRLAALLHDIGKPACKVEMTFYNHDQVGKELAGQLLKRLKFSNDDIAQVVNLVGTHMFDYSREWSDAAVRRFIRRIGGRQNVASVFALRRADAAAMKQDIGLAYLTELQQRIDKIIADENALHVADLKIDGHDVMQTLNIKPGPQVGKILNELLERVLDDPSLNDRATLLALVKQHA